MFDIAQDVTVNNKTLVLVNDDVFKAHEVDEKSEEESEEEPEIPVETEAEEEFESNQLVSQLLELEPLVSVSDVTNARIDYVDKPIPKKFVFTKTTKQIQSYEPIISEGLVILTEITPSSIGTELPQTLIDLFNKYKDDLSEY